MTLPTNPPDQTLVGRVIGDRFRVTRLIARGGMAVVYEAEQPLGDTTRKVALKTLRIHATQDPSVSARFKRECETISALTHPTTVRVYDFGDTPDGLLYIAMEFVPGKALGDVMDVEGPMSPSRVLNIIRQIAGALQEAHALGVIHRDLKPDNIVLQRLNDGEDTVRLLDFGIAARTVDPDGAARLTQQGMVLGTPPYMSPEQFTGKPLDASSDVYSLAVMTYEMLTGQLPLQAASPWQWAGAHMQQEPAPFESTSAGAAVPVAMRRAVLHGLAKKPGDRPASVREFLAELSGFAGGSSLAPGSAVIAPPSNAPSTAGMPAPPPAFGSSFAGTAPMAAAPEVRRVPTTKDQPVAATATAAPMRDKGRGRALAIGLILVLLLTAGGLLATGQLPGLALPVPWTSDDLPPLPLPSAAVDSPENQGLKSPNYFDDLNTSRRPGQPSRSPSPAPSPRPAPAPSPAPGPAPAPTASSPAEAPSATPPSLPTSGAIACRSDADCVWNRCNPDTNRCIWPCTSDGDCRAGARCFPLLGGACIYGPSSGGSSAPAAPTASATPPSDDNQ